MKNYVKISALLLITAAMAFPRFNGHPAVKTGIEVLRDRNFDILQGKRVGLITNPTGVDSKLKSTIDILNEAPGVKLTAMYGPEHGVRGDYSAGEKVDYYTDKKTGIPVYSLYGKTSKPTEEMLKDVDVLVYDIQDIGCRSYTYISTMGKAMEAAAEFGKDFVVLDRPNPLGGLKIEGNIVEDGFFSMVSNFPIPYVYGMTSGEVATIANEEGYLKDGVKCNLTVVPMEGWTRAMKFEDTGLPWVPSSPHIPHAYSAPYYVATGVMGELGVISEGVGYTLPFQVYAAEWMDAQDMADAMNGLGLDGVLFRPINFKPYYGKWEGKMLHGVQVHIFDEDAFDLMGLQFMLMEQAHKLYPDQDLEKMSEKRHRMFDKVTGSDKIREKFFRKYRYKDIKSTLDKDVKSFRKLSEKYYLYK